MPVRDMIEGRAALIVGDIQKGCFVDPREDDPDRSISIMKGNADRMLNARPLIDKAR
ncbi:MAG: hypothetical protein AAFN79_20535 [Pseudomonadota bacterium]